MSSPFAAKKPVKKRTPSRSPSPTRKKNRVGEGPGAPGSPGSVVAVAEKPVTGEEDVDLDSPGEEPPDVDVMDKREHLELIVSPAPESGASLIGRVVIFDDDDAMKGIVQGFIKGDGEDEDDKVLIQPTHANGQALTPEEVTAFTDGKGTMSWSADRVKVVPDTVEIKKVPPGGVDITHFHHKEMTASEYIIPHGDGKIEPKNSIVITNHGLGSGIYGIAEATAEQIEAAANFHFSSPHTVHLNNPLYLQDAMHGRNLTELSKTMQRVAEAFRDANGVSKSLDGFRDWIAARPELTDMTRTLVSVVAAAGGEITADSAQRKLVDSLEAFFVRYYSGDPVVAQPLNFLLHGQLGYDGIYATDTENNSYGRGCVSFTVSDTTPKTTRADRPLTVAK